MGHDALIIQQLGVGVYLNYPSTHHRLSWSTTGAGTLVSCAGVESTLSSSLDEAYWDVVAGVEAFSDPETSCEPDTSSEPEASSEYVVEPEGVPVSMRSSSDWEVVPTPGATFVGVALVVRAARAGVIVSGGTYSGSRSLSEPMTSQADGATDFERSHAYTRSSFCAKSVST